MTRSADFLLVDIGNTSAKLRLSSPTHLVGETRRISMAALVGANDAAVWREAVAGWEFGQMVLSSVVPAATRVVLEAWPQTLIVQPETNTGVDLCNYPGGQTLGADRLANVAGALALYGPGPLIVADFGTAATFNALDSASRFLGGAIAPGLAAVRDYLPSRTAQLPAVDLPFAPPPAIGRNTREAILAGTTLGYRGLVRELLAALRAELAPGNEAAVRVIATGGDAAWIARILPDAIAVVAPDLTLHGLRIIASQANIHPAG